MEKEPLCCEYKMENVFVFCYSSFLIYNEPHKCRTHLVCIIVETKQEQVGQKKKKRGGMPEVRRGFQFLHTFHLSLDRLIWVPAGELAPRSIV